MIELETTYLGLKLANPLVASASPLSKHIDTVRRLEEAGVSALVMHSLFEEQVIRESQVLDYFLANGSESFAEALSYLPNIGTYSIGPEAYVEQLARLKHAVKIPVIASLKGVSRGGWLAYARMLEQAGADAIELNTYVVPTNYATTPQEIETNTIELVQQVRAQVSIPIAVKLSPFFTALPHFIKQLANAGANGLVLFNRFYQPDVDIETLEIVPSLQLSTSNELRLALRWIALLSGRLPVDFAATGGVHSAEDIVKAMMVGANITMLASALLKQGPEYARTLLRDLVFWLEDHEYSSIRQMQGSMRQGAVADPAAFERANYMKVLGSYDTDPRFAPYRARSRSSLDG